MGHRCVGFKAAALPTAKPVYISPSVSFGAACSVIVAPDVHNILVDRNRFVHIFAIERTSVTPHNQGQAIEHDIVRNRGNELPISS
jgi:hypothetical protein